MSETALKTLKTYIKPNLANIFMRRLSSQVKAPIVFANPKDIGFRLCIDYRALNKVTVKNRHPLPLISEMIDSVRGA